MNAPVLELPQLTGTRDRARRLLEQWDLPLDLSQASVHLDAGPTLAGTDSFADELVRVILVERHALQLIVSLVGVDFAEKFRSAAGRHGVQDRLITLDGPDPQT